MNSYININQESNMSNDYLAKRNALNYRGNIETLHPLFEAEFKNGQHSILNFLDNTVLSKAKFLRLKKLYALSSEKCFNNKANNYTFSEAQVCEETLITKDPVLVNIQELKKEVSVRILDNYEKSAKNYTKNSNFSVDIFEQKHRNYLNRLNTYDRYMYYFLASGLFLGN